MVIDIKRLSARDEREQQTPIPLLRVCFSARRRLLDCMVAGEARVDLRRSRDVGAALATS
jgi:hypothetical protein